MRTLEVFGRRVAVEYVDGRWVAFHPHAEGKRPAAYAAPIPAFVQSEAELFAYLADLWHEEARPDRREVRWLP